MRIGFIHATVGAIDPIMEIAAKEYPDMQILNFVNENLLDHANRVGGVDDFGRHQFSQLFEMALESELDGIVIACTLFSACAEELGKDCKIPVIGIDRPMIEKSIEDSSRIGIVATTAASGPAAERKLLSYAESVGKSVEISQEIVTEAMSRRKEGKIEEHNRIVAEAAKRLKDRGCEIVILAQITMACASEAAEALGVSVLTSPKTGLEQIRKLVEDQKR